MRGLCRAQKRFLIHSNASKLNTIMLVNKLVTEPHKMPFYQIVTIFFHHACGQIPHSLTFTSELTLRAVTDFVFEGNILLLIVFQGKILSKKNRRKIILLKCRLR